MHLLALLIEVVSIKVAGKQIKKAIDIPRPGKPGKGKRHHPEDPRGQQQQAPRQQAKHPAASRDAAFKQGIAVLAGSARTRKG